MNKVKKTIAIILCLIMATASLAFAEETMLVSAGNKDYEGHWAQATIQKWMDEGKIEGYPDGSYKPDGNVTRAEFVKLVNGIINFNKGSNVTYKDVQSTEWYYDYVGIAQEIGYITGYSAEKFGPNDYITREQAASILARIQYLKNNAAGAEKFNDKNKISSWAVEAVGASSEAGFIAGYNDGSFKPSNNLTRAEAITMLDNVLVNSKNFVVYNAGTELKDAVIDGDLIIAKTVGDGDVYLTNLVVNGEVLIYGGGMNSLYFNNVQVAKIDVEKDKVRLVFDDGSTVEQLIAGSETILENTDGTIAKVIETGDSQVTLIGNFDEVDVVGNGNIILDHAVITTLIVDQPITIEGTGTIETLDAHVNGIHFEAEVTIDTTVVGEGVTEEPVVVEEEVVIGGGGGGAIIVPTNPAIIITVKSPDETLGNAFRTEDYSNADTLYDAIVGILNDPDYESLITTELNKFSSRLNNMQVGASVGPAAIWDRAVNYLPETIDVSGLESGFTDGSITITDLNSLLAVYDDATSTELNLILDNLIAAGFDDVIFKYNVSDITYTVSSQKATIPTGNIGIADFVLNEVLIPDMTVGEFFETYGNVTFTAIYSGDPVKTATITLTLVK